MTYRSENIDNVGFRRSALIAFLALDGIHLSGVAAKKKPLKPVPAWADARKGIRRLSLPEAAKVLNGIDPLDGGQWQGEHEWREFESAKRVLLEAVEAKELSVADIDFGNDAVEIFNTADLRAWAIAAGYDWPIPQMPVIAIPGSAASIQAADSDLVQRLQDSERERTQLQQEVERLRAQAQEVSTRDGRLAEQAVRIGQLQAESSKNQTEIQRLQTEIAQGKSLSALQKLVIGMALGGYGYTPSEAKSPVPKQISDDMAGRGISITDDTVRKYLRQAAAAHLPKV